MNDIQKTEFEILKHTVAICDDLGLKYFLVCGSALGAVKYKGFIPWDDDIDIALYRDDYEIFCKEAQRRLPDYLFLQNSNSDKYFPAFYSKIRDSRTTYIEKSVKGIDMHHGVYIDVFPLDGYVNKKSSESSFERKKQLYLRLLSTSYDIKFERGIKGKVLDFLLNLTNIKMFYRVINKSFNKFLSSYKIDNSQLVCNHGNWQGRLEYAPKEQYGEGVMATFEGLSVRIPEKYDEYLTQKYGDWRADLPEDQRVGHHYYTVCDVDRPYTDYVKVSSFGKVSIVNI